MTKASTPTPFDAQDPKNPVIIDGEVTWTFDADFLTSNWTCIWGRGCLGIHDNPSEELQQGCCSVGAELDGEDVVLRLPVDETEDRFYRISPVTAE
jgi:hypothetical protein